jgi:RNA polymerase sigma-70 factor, ECF subfamily
MKFRPSIMPHKKNFVERRNHDHSQPSDIIIAGMDESALIRSAVEGDLNSFNRLVLEYQEAAFNVALRMMGEVPAAEDAAQTAFISAFKNLHQYRGGSFKAWVLRMVTNACYDELRKQKRRPTVSLDGQGNDEDMDVQESRYLIDPQAPNPQEELEKAELEHAIQHCLDELPADFRAAVILADIEGLDYEDIARASGSPLGTIKSRLARARFKLRDCLKGFEELLPARFRLINENME